MKYTITIKDNETGAIVKQIDCDAIIAGCHVAENETASIGVTNCSSEAVVMATAAAHRAIDEVVAQTDILTKAMYLVSRVNAAKKKTEEINDE